MEHVPAPNPLVTSLPMLSTAAIPLNRNNACASMHVYTYIDVAQNDDDYYNDDTSIMTIYLTIYLTSSSTSSSLRFHHDFDHDNHHHLRPPSLSS
jgi:hypothetical protein